MDIKIVMHSVLDCHLKPDLELLKNACKELSNEGKIVNRPAFEEFLRQVKTADDCIQKENECAEAAKKAATPEEKSAILAEKKNQGALADQMLENALTTLAEAGGMDAYHYNYDLHFNRIVAGLMGSTCYMKDTFEQLQNKGIRNILTIASVVEQNGHHSTFGHSHVTFQITGIPKALAMVLNNEKEYCTSEKSARYTVMTDVEPTQSALYDKWKEIFVEEISKRYGDCRPFFDAKGTKVEKLAQENARYMLSVFTPTNMVYTTSFRQLNYLAHWFENEIANPKSNSFYLEIKKDMQEFVDFVKDNGLYSEFLEDNKDRELSMFGTGILNEILSSSVYAVNYDASLAFFAQAERHRTINYHINEFLYEHLKPSFFVPPILKNSSDLVGMWNEDIAKVSEYVPQGRIVPIIENGDTSDFLLKAKERVCAQAQWEIMDNTRTTAQRLSRALGKELVDGKQALDSGMLTLDFSKNHNLLDSPEKFEIELLNKGEILKGIREKKEKLDKLSEGARCTAGYKCTAPCGFAEGINLERKI